MTSLDLLDGDLPVQKLLLADLSETARALLVRIWQLDTGPSLLQLLRTHPRTFLTADDIAYELGESPKRAERDLRVLVRLGIVQLTQVTDFTLFGLTLDGEHQGVVQELGTWQDRWEVRLAKMRHIVLGRRDDHPHPDTELHELSD
jgi:hypothetical protein